ncbi:MAG: hypothetical protein K1X94_28215 [Sandaracinaceae bacterium]|nr:hypothetical protein [Sandaracinaceae bacterium]
MRTLAHGRVSNCLVLVHGRDAPRDDEWRDWVRTVLEFKGGHPRICVRTHGGGPNAKQRQVIAHSSIEKFGRPASTAVVTDSVVIRGMITAFHWLVPSGDIRAFAPQALPDALDHLSVPRPFHPTVLETIRRLEREVVSSDLSLGT